MPKALTSFTPFPTFPNEIKFMIWEEAVLQQAPRLVPIRYRDEDGFTSNARIPGVLHACRESRRAGLKRYRLAFAIDATEYTEEELESDDLDSDDEIYERKDRIFSAPQIFFDFDTDIAYIGLCSEGRHSRALAERFLFTGGQVDERDVHAVRNLAMSIYTFAELDWYGYRLDLVRKIKYVEKFYLVCECYAQEFTDLELVDPKDLETKASACSFFSPPEASFKYEVLDSVDFEPSFIDDDEGRMAFKELQEEMKEKMALKILAGLERKLFTTLFDEGSTIIDHLEYPLPLRMTIYPCRCKATCNYCGIERGRHDHCRSRSDPSDDNFEISLFRPNRRASI